MRAPRHPFCGGRRRGGAPPPAPRYRRPPARDKKPEPVTLPDGDPVSGAPFPLTQPARDRRPVHQARRALTLYRLRWQVELAFKRWKSLCHFDRLPNYRDDTIFSWLYAKLLLALLMHRMVSGTSPLFPPEAQEVPSLALHAVEGDQHRMARNRRRALAA